MKNTIRVLLITYAFPPIGEPRSFRWLNLSREFCKGCCSFDVLTIKSSIFHENYDSAMNRMVRVGGDVVRTYPGPIYSNRYRKPSNGGFALSGSGSFLKNAIRFFLIPDMSIEWLPWGYLRGKALVRQNSYDVIISSGYPFTSHILAYLLKRIKPGIKWIADYGDPWSFNPDRKVLPVGRKIIDQAIEQHLLKQCDRVIVTTDETRTGFLEHFRFLSRDSIEVLPQGYDPAEFLEARPEKGARFRIVYTGAFYDTIREPFEFYGALRALSDLDIEVVIVGNVSKRFQMDAERVMYIGHQSHDRVLSLQKGADILLFLANASAYQLPGKIFEYFAAQRPILCLKSVEPDISANLIQKHKRGLSVVNKSAHIAEAIRNLYQRWKDNRMEEAFDLNPVEDYTWNVLAKRLGDVIGRVTGAHNTL